jgi:hypothetical protein
VLILRKSFFKEFQPLDLGGLLVGTLSLNGWRYFREYFARNFAVQLASLILKTDSWDYLLANKALK